MFSHVDETNSAGGLKVRDETKKCYLVSFQGTLTFDSANEGKARVFVQDFQEIIEDSYAHLIMKRMRERSSDVVNKDETPCADVHVVLSEVNFNNA